MPSRLNDILPLGAAFTPLFSDRVRQHAQLLGEGRGERHFGNDHHVLSRAVWCAREGSRLLLGLIVATLLPAGAALLIGADDTRERHNGRYIKATGGYRDAGRSRQKPSSAASGSNGWC